MENGRHLPLAALAFTSTHSIPATFWKGTGRISGGALTFTVAPWVQIRRLPYRCWPYIGSERNNVKCSRQNTVAKGILPEIEIDPYKKNRRAGHATTFLLPEMGSPFRVFRTMWQTLYPRSRDNVFFNNAASDSNLSVSQHCRLISLQCRKSCCERPALRKETSNYYEQLASTITTVSSFNLCFQWSFSLMFSTSF